MKKIYILPALAIAVLSCTNSANTDVRTSDTVGQKNPDGMVNSNRISTDTAAYRVDTISKKADKLADSVFKK